MTIIELNANSWRTWEDFYSALLAALGAPKSHGRNLNALIDSMVWGGMNAVEPPYKILVSGTKNLSKDTRAEIDAVKQGLANACAERGASDGRDVEIGFEITS
jgi:RNAse (barnase) inhibitor barstar